MGWYVRIGPCSIQNTTTPSRIFIQTSSDNRRLCNGWAAQRNIVTAAKQTSTTRDRLWTDFL
eukprot:2722321-Amphidinium_carterae.1